MTARLIFSLSALAASLFAGVGTPVSQPSHESRPRLLRFVSPFSLSVSEHASPDRPFVHTTDATFALTATPFRRSLWLMTSLVAVDLIERQHRREFLRC